MLGTTRIPQILLVLAAIASVAAMLFIAPDARAEPKATTTMQLPKGATVQIDRQGVARLNNNGATGTFDCRCSGDNATGTCILGRGDTAIICGTGGSTCNGTCKLFTTTNGLRGGVMMKSQ